MSSLTTDTSRVGLGLAKELLRPDARTIHLFAFSTSFGASLWHGFIAGIISYKVLPRQTFGNLQSKLFPVYFALNTVLSAVMVGTLAYEYPIIREKPFEIGNATVYQGFTLAATTLAHLLNAVVVGPASTKVMFERHRQERAEQKDYKDPNASDKLKELTVKFTTLHSVSSTLNLIAFGGLVAHGLWLAKRGFALASLARVAN